jgi:hypothetical protein
MAKRDLLSYSPELQNYFIAAVHTSLEAHQVAWTLNRMCNTQFWRNVNLLKIPVQKTDSEFINFQFKLPHSEDWFWLIGNSGTTGYLYNSKPKPDFLIISRDEEADIHINQWVNLINRDPGINKAYLLNAEAVKSMKWLIWLDEWN